MSQQGMCVRGLGVGARGPALWPAEGHLPHVPLGRDGIPVAHEVGPMKDGGRGGFWFYLNVSSFNLIPFVYR